MSEYWASQNQNDFGHDPGPLPFARHENEREESMSEAPPKDFGFGPDEEMLRDLARSFLDERLPAVSYTHLRAHQT